MRQMFDSINASAIPANAGMVAGYCDGLYAWTTADWDRFPNAVKVRIAVFASTNDGHVLDVENGNATPGQAPGWVAMRRKAGVEPTVYCSLNSWPTVRSAFLAAGVAEPPYWVAYYDYIPTIPTGAVAKQYTDNPPGNPYDTSAVADFWPGVDSIQEEDEVLLIFEATVVAGEYKGQQAQFVSNGMFYRWIQNTTQLGDISQVVGPVFNKGPVQTWTPGQPVLDPGAFGTPADAVTAAMLGVPFGPTPASYTLSGTATPS